MKKYRSNEEFEAVVICDVGTPSTVGNYGVIDENGDVHQYSTVDTKRTPVKGDYIVYDCSGISKEIKGKFNFEANYSLVEKATGGQINNGVSGSIKGRPSKLDIHFLASIWEREYFRYMQVRDDQESAIVMANDLVEECKKQFDV